MRQLLDLESVWRKHDYFFVTEDTALGRTLAQDHPTHFLPHFAWGQVKHGRSFAMLRAAMSSFLRSAVVIGRLRPDFIITTGAGAVYFPVLWGRLFGAKVIAIESFARFKQASLFGRIVAPIAHHFIVQSPYLARRYSGAKVFDPLRILNTPAPPKENILFATVGATLPFDRLVSSVAELHDAGEISGRVIMQTGVGGLAPPGLEVHETLPFDEVRSILRRASIVVCHGGTGSIVTALREGCHVIVMPRFSGAREHYDDHQSEISEAFAARGLVTVARNVAELKAAIASATDAPRVVATTDATALNGYLDELLIGAAAPT